MRRIDRLIAYLHENFHEPITIKEIARKEGVTANYLSRYFSKHIHRRFITYLNGVRIEKACFLLKNTDQTVESICFDCGYNTPGFFYVQFKKCKGCTPKMYRMQNNSLKLHGYNIK